MEVTGTLGGMGRVYSYQSRKGIPNKNLEFRELHFNMFTEDITMAPFAGLRSICGVLMLLSSNNALIYSFQYSLS